MSELPIDINIREAADAARRLVSEKLQLQGLVAVLDDLAGQQNLRRELTAEIATLQKTLKDLNSEIVGAREKHAWTLESLRQEVGRKRHAEDELLTKLTAECMRAEADRDLVRAELKAAQDQLARTRAVLASAANSVGVA